MLFYFSCSFTFFELYSCFICISPLLYLQHNTILFYLLPFSFSFHPYFIAIPPPTRLHLQSFHPSFSPLFPFPIISISLSFIPISIPIKILFSTPPQFLCYKGMANLSCNSYDIAPQKQCNCHLKALLLERNSYSFAPQRLCPQPTRA